VPFPSQTPGVVARRTLRALERDRADIFPSFLFRTMRALRPFLPFTARVYQWRQQRVLAAWARAARR